MKKFTVLFFLSLVALAFVISFIFVVSAKTGDSSSGVGLEEGFVHPPAPAKAHTWWHWMNGNISREGITADLEAMADAGIGGAQIFNGSEDIPHGPVQFNSPEWLDMVKHAAAEAKRLGLDLCIHNCAGWANSGGPWNTPEHSMKIVVTGEMRVQGGSRLSAPPPQPAGNMGFYRDIAVLAFPAKAVRRAIPELNAKIYLQRADIPSAKTADYAAEAAVRRDEIIDLTEKFLPPDGKTGTWDVPEGEWTVLRVGYTSNGRKNHPSPAEGEGLECDKLSREAVKAHWDGHLGLILEALGKNDGADKPGLNGVLVDSYEVGTQNWTQGFENEFHRRCGYSLLKFLPAFTGRIVDTPDVTERFLWDLRRVISDLFAENYSAYFGELAHRAGLSYFIEPYGNSPSDDIQYGSYGDVPMGEFWSNMDGKGVNISHVAYCKLASSVAHVYGKRITGAEAFTADPNGGKWQKDPFAMKAHGDAIYCAGVNRMIYHRYAHQPWTDPVRYPGMTMGRYGTHFERTLTWWHHAGEWLTYQARCQYMLQEGRFVADVLFYCGEGAPNEVRTKQLPQGYDYDGCDAQALKTLKVKNGRLTLPSGMSYRILVLPDDPAMSPEILNTVGKLADAGAVIVGRTKPERAQGLRDYPSSDAAVKKAADRVWAKVISDKSPAEVLTDIGLPPDFSADEGAGLAYIHRQAGETDIYFVACPGLQGDELTCTFRVGGRIPEFWDPATGSIEVAPVFEEKDGRTLVPVRFEPAGSVFVVFRKPVTGDHAVSATFTAAPETSGHSGNLKIVKAEYGYFADENPGNYANVTEIVRQLFAAGNRKIAATNGAMGGDPADGVVKELSIRYRSGGAERQEQARENLSVELPADAEIIKAFYGVITDDIYTERIPQIADVTEQLNRLADGGILRTVVNDALTGGKTISGNRKKIKVEYICNGVRGSWHARENQVLRLPPEQEYELKAQAGGEVECRAWKPGVFEWKTASGKTGKIDVPAIPQAVEITGEWRLSFPPGWGAPEEITLDTLISWTEHAEDGVKYFSGTATYTKHFTWDAGMEEDTKVILDLGSLRNFADVQLNGQSLPLLWKPPYRLDVTEALRRGENLLEIKITNLWPNRLIGDEQLLDDRSWNGDHLTAFPQWVIDGKPSPTGRFTFTTWHYWHRDDMPLPSGLFGPVCLRSMKSVKTAR
jgi:hypothetical protein